MIYIAHTDPTNFIAVPNPLHFRSETVIMSIRPRIRNRSLSDPIRIREKNMVKDMVEAKSDPIRSVYIPSNDRFKLALIVQRNAVSYYIPRHYSNKSISTLFMYASRPSSSP